MNIVHRIPPEKVSQSVAAKIAEDERLYQSRVAQIDVSMLEYAAATESAKKRWTCVPCEERKLEERRYHDQRIQREQEHYATVRVVEVPKASPRSKKNRFLLIYGPQDDQSLALDGTGPFETYFKAESWFLNGGR